jgi:hypothetical protein
LGKYRIFRRRNPWCSTCGKGTSRRCRKTSNPLCRRGKSTIDSPGNQYHDQEKSQTYHVIPHINDGVDCSFLINNKGYTIEKFIHGADKEYNNVADWKYGRLLEVFGAKNPRSFRASTKDELTKLLDDKEFAAAKEIQVCALAGVVDCRWLNL